MVKIGVENVNALKDGDGVAAQQSTVDLETLGAKPCKSNSRVKVEDCQVRILGTMRDPEFPCPLPRMVTLVEGMEIVAQTLNLPSR